MTPSITVGIAGGRGELRSIAARRRVESHYGVDNLQAAVLGVTYTETGGKLIDSWVGLTVYADSAFHAYKSQCGQSSRSQLERADRYQRILVTYPRFRPCETRWARGEA